MDMQDADPTTPRQCMLLSMRGGVDNQSQADVRAEQQLLCFCPLGGVEALNHVAVK